MAIELKKNFSTRKELIQYVQEFEPKAKGSESFIQGGLNACKDQLNSLNPTQYGRTRNYLEGDVTKLSPYISHGILTPKSILDKALESTSQPEKIEKFIQQLMWREFFNTYLSNNPQAAWMSVEPYKTGLSEDEYLKAIPSDILEGSTGVACIDTFIQELVSTGYLHNHARLYLASYVVHFRKIAWQVGAEWFLYHLLDAHIPSNNLSWQWVASTFSSKPYIFNLENVRKYASKSLDTSPESNVPLDATYDELNFRLFPNIYRQ